MNPRAVQYERQDTEQVHTTWRSDEAHPNETDQVVSVSMFMGGTGAGQQGQGGANAAQLYGMNGSAAGCQLREPVAQCSVEVQTMPCNLPRVSDGARTTPPVRHGVASSSATMAGTNDTADGSIVRPIPLEFDEACRAQVSVFFGGIVVIAACQSLSCLIGFHCIISVFSR